MTAFETRLFERTGCAIWRIDGKFWPVQYYSEGRIRDIGGRDAPHRGGWWSAEATEEGVRYVATPSPSRRAALARIRRAFPGAFPLRALKEKKKLGIV